MLKVVITGGPGGGKTESMSVLTQELEERGYKVFFVPETATELILNGICPGTNISMEDFQKFVIKKQLSKEVLYDEASTYYDMDRVVIFYDRGLMDNAAYVSKPVFEKLLKEQNLSFTDVYARYDAVVHLVTAANGAVEFYQWNDPTKEETGNNAARSESPEEAIIKDEKTLNAWVGHPHLRVFDNSTDFKGKIQRVVNEVFALLGEPVPKEIERKFLIKKPTQEEIEALGYMSKTNIIQTYLRRKNPDVERRVRQRGSKEDGFSFYYTEKTDLTDGERLEKEEKITPAEYIAYLSEANTLLHQVSKTRYCFIYENQYFELDVYPFSNEYAIIEIELNDINDEIHFPPLTFVKEVTNEADFKNCNLAKNLRFNVENVLTDDDFDWTYETGEVELEILGSGCRYYNVEKSKDKEKIFAIAKENPRNYLTRYRKENGVTVYQQWDGYSKSWIY